MERMQVPWRELDPFNSNEIKQSVSNIFQHLAHLKNKDFGKLQTSFYQLFKLELQSQESSFSYSANVSFLVF